MNEVKALSDATINPNGTMPDVYAVAPYICGTTVSALGSAIPGIKVGFSRTTCAAMASLPLISYEGGSGLLRRVQLPRGPGRPGHARRLHLVPRRARGRGLTGPFMQYTHTGACWGLKVKTSDATTAAPKYQGLLDWLAAHP